MARTFNMWHVSALCAFALSLVGCANGLKILGVFPMPARSHYILGTALMRELAGRGHDVTYISSFGEKDVPKEWKWRDIVLTGFTEQREKEAANMFEIKGYNPILTLMFMNFVGNKVTDLTFNHTNVQNLLKSKEKFDIVIIEQFVNDAQKIFATHFGASLVMLSTIGPNAWVNPLMGNPAPPSYIPEMLLSYSPKMNIWERTFNSIMNVAGELNRHLIFFPEQNRILKKYFPNAPDLTEINYNVSLILLNSYVATNQPVPLLPNMVEIGGYHVKPPNRLPKDLQEFLDKSPEGVIYFSMGSNLKSKDLPKEKRDALLKSFSKLKQKVLWKWEDDVLPGQPPNVKLSKWFPQQDVLAHKNIKAFITHGGLLSITETIYHGVPILAIPIFGDQELNAAAAVDSGFCVKVPYEELTEESLTKALYEVLHNPKYANNAKTRSKIHHDRPVKPMDLAVYWIEYVARHKGATHFRSVALDLRWYQYLLLDVLLILAVGSTVFIAAFYVIVKLLCCRRKKSQADSKSSKKKKQ